MAGKTDNYQTWVNLVTGLYVLRILDFEQAHGNKIAGEIRQRTGGMISPNSNALYPLLRTMEEQGHIAGEWENPHTRSKRVYQITAKGRNYIPFVQNAFKQRLEDAERQLQVLRNDLLADFEMRNMNCMQGK